MILSQAALRYQKIREQQEKIKKQQLLIKNNKERVQKIKEQRASLKEQKERFQKIKEQQKKIKEQQLLISTTSFPVVSNPPERIKQPKKNQLEPIDQELSPIKFNVAKPLFETDDPNQKALDLPQKEKEPSPQKKKPFIRTSLASHTTLSGQSRDKAILRKTFEYEAFRNTVVKDWDNCCAITGLTQKDAGNALHVHHLINLPGSLYLFFNPLNGVLLLPLFHMLFHHWYQNKNNTLDQMLFFLQQLLEPENEQKIKLFMFQKIRKTQPNILFLPQDDLIGEGKFLDPVRINRLIVELKKRASYLNKASPPI